MAKLPAYTSAAWEELCRQAVPFLMPDKNFTLASRWWGGGIDGSAMELGVVAESADKKTLLAGEAKWIEKTDLTAEYELLRRKVANLSFTKGHRIIYALFVRHKPSSLPQNVIVFGPKDVVEAFK